jgi:hypothetical protein
VCAEAALLAEHEATERWEAAAVEARLAQEGQANGPPCPVCKRRELLQNRHVIFCGCGGVRLETQHEGFTLDVRGSKRDAHKGERGVFEEGAPLAVCARGDATGRERGPFRSLSLSLSLSRCQRSRCRPVPNLS